MPGVETIIEINKGGSGLGLSIVGGSDTLLGVIIIHEVYEDGAAYQDGRLQSGNRVFWVAKLYSNRTSLMVYYISVMDWQIGGMVCWLIDRLVD